MSLYELRTYTLRVGAMAEAVKLYQEFGFPALQRGGQDKKARRILPKRYRHHQSAFAFVEVRRRRRPPRALGLSVREQGFRRGLCLEVPPTADDAGSEAAPGCAVGPHP
jgi:hypothetical protein